MQSRDFTFLAVEVNKVQNGYDERGLRENLGRFSTGQRILQVDKILDFKHLSLIKSDIQKFMV